MAPGYRRFRTLGLMTSPARANIAAIWTRALFTIRPHLTYLGTLHKEFALLPRHFVACSSAYPGSPNLHTKVAVEMTIPSL